MKGKFVVIVCRNINPSLRHFLSLFLTEIAPLTFAGVLSRRVKDRLWETLTTEYHDYQISMVESIKNNENGFTLKENFHTLDQYTQEVNGIILGMRRVKEKEEWEKVLGKTKPVDYPLIKHLIDTMAMADIFFEEVLSDAQKKLIFGGFELENSEDKENKIKNIILMAAGLHDIGKVDPRWQNRVLKTNIIHEEKSSLNISFKHDIAGGTYFYNKISNPVSTENYCENILNFLIETTVSHHGDFSLKRELSDHLDNYKMGEKWLNIQNSIENQILSLIGMETVSDYPCKEIESSVVVIVSGLVVFADWLASRDDFINSGEVYDDYVEHYKAAKNKAYELVSSLGLKKPVWRKDLTWGKIFPQFAEPNDFQRTLVNNQGLFEKNGLTIINAPMGYGKTEASLFIAAINGSHNNNNGLWVTLPTQATSNALFTRAVDISSHVFVEGNSVSLLHSNAAISDAVESFKHKNNNIDFVNPVSNIHDDGEVESDDDSGNNFEMFISDFLVERKLGGMSSVAVSTIDQLLFNSIPLKHNMLRWLTTTGKTIIIDEVHDFDAYTFHLIEKIVAWCGEFNINVVVMSATLSGESQKKLAEAYINSSDNTIVERNIPANGLDSPSWVNFSQISETENSTQPVVTHSGFIQNNADDIFYNIIFEENANELSKNVVDILDEHLPHKPNVLIVAHTIEQSIYLFREIQKEYPDYETILLHSRMPHWQKEQKIGEMLKWSGKPSDLSARKPHIVVSTQIVQQSMDIDYDLLITPMTILPNLLQRIGRIHRHNQKDRRSAYYNNNPYVYVICPSNMVDFVSQEEPLSELDKKFFIPNNMWEVISSYHAFKKYCSTSGKNNIKKDMKKIFDTYYDESKKLQKEDKYKKIMKEHLHSEIQKKSLSKNLSVNNPIKYVEDMLDFNLTTNYTKNSRFAPKTRLFLPTENVIFLIKEENEYRIVQTVEDNIINSIKINDSSYDSLRKQIGENSIIMSKYFYEKNVENNGKIEPEKLSKALQTMGKYTKFHLFDEKYDTIINKREGLTIKSEIPDSENLWK